MKLPLLGKITLAAIIFNLLQAVSIFFLQSHLPPLVPLFYGLPVGTDQLAPSIYLTFPATVATALGSINIFIIHFTKDNFLQKILTSLTIVITALSVITITKIFLLVGSF